MRGSSRFRKFWILSRLLWLLLLFEESGKNDDEDEDALILFSRAFALAAIGAARSMSVICFSFFINSSFLVSILPLSGAILAGGE